MRANTHKRSQLASRFVPGELAAKVGCVASLACVFSASGQNALPGYQVSASPSTLPPLAPALPPRDSLFRLGPFKFAAGISGQMMYDDNVTIRSADKQSDVIWSVSPHIQARTAAGDRNVSLGYGFSYNSYLRNSTYNNISHNANASGTWEMSKLRLGLNAGLNQSTGGYGDVGTLTETKSYNIGLTADYKLSEKTSVDVSPRVSFSDYGNAAGYTNALYNSMEWSVATFINRTPFPKIKLGLGLDVGSTGVSQYGDQIFARALFRANYKLTGKLDLTSSAGAEWRHYDGGVPDTINPIFNLAGSYRPVLSTTITLNAHITPQASAYYGNQNYITTGFSLTVSQRLGERLSANLGGAYDVSQYSATEVGVSTSRVDDSFSVNFGITYAITERWSAGLTATYRQNLSNSGGFGYDNKQIGLQTSYEF